MVRKSRSNGKIQFLNNLLRMLLPKRVKCLLESILSSWLQFCGWFVIVTFVPKYSNLIKDTSYLSKLSDKALAKMTPNFLILREADRSHFQTVSCDKYICSPLLFNYFIFKDIKTNSKENSGDKTSNGLLSPWQTWSVETPYF